MLMHFGILRLIYGCDGSMVGMWWIMTLDMKELEKYYYCKAAIFWPLGRGCFTSNQILTM